MSNPQPVPPPDAGPTVRGLMSKIAQKFSGLKTFLNGIQVGEVEDGDLPSGGVELRGSLLYNTSTGRLQVHDGVEWRNLALGSTGGDVDLSTIGYSGGQHVWADGYQQEPNNAQHAVRLIVEILSSAGGALKVGAETPDGQDAGSVQQYLNKLQSEKVSLISQSGSWTDLSPYVAVSGGWVAGTGDWVPRAIVRGDKVVYAGYVQRTTADLMNQVLFTDLPVEFRSDRPQYRTAGLLAPDLAPGITYFPALVSGPTTTDGNFYLWNEPRPVQDNFWVYLDGLEFYWSMGVST